MSLRHSAERCYLTIARKEAVNDKEEGHGEKRDDGAKTGKTDWGAGNSIRHGNTTPIKRKAFEKGFWKRSGIRENTKCGQVPPIRSWLLFPAWTRSS